MAVETRKMQQSFSMNVIAHTLSQHSEMIAPGVMGINFMKPEKPVNTMSEVYKLIQEEEQCKVKSPTPGAGATSPIFKPSKVPPVVQEKPKQAPTTVNTFVPFSKPVPKTPPPTDGPVQGHCTDCGRTIVGPFVNLSDRMLHEDCFKCSTCGSSLKNIGYHNINSKLYCDTHAQLAARVIAAAISGGSPTPPIVAPSYSPAPLPKSTFGSAPVASPKPVSQPGFAPAPHVAPALKPQPSAVPSLPSSNVPQALPTPFGQNLPHSPSSSGNLAYRSISPLPFKPKSVDFHKVVAPKSPTPRSTPTAPPAYSSGPLPFEMKPYMPPEQSKSSIFSLLSDSSSSVTGVSQTTQSTQIIQKTTQITKKVSHSSSSQESSSQSQFAVDYKQVTGGQSSKKFVWPPLHPQIEADGSISSSSSAGQSQNYSPLATQSTPASTVQPTKNETPTPFHSVKAPETKKETQKQQEAPQIPTPPSTFSAPPPEPAKVEEAPAPAPAPPKQEEKPASSAPSVAPPSILPSANQARNFAPALPPIVDLKQPSTPTQPGVPTGAGSKPAPKKGRGQLMKEHTAGRIAICGDCGEPIRGPFIIALNRTWCPDHFHCNNMHCKIPLIEIGFVEEQGQLYCENCYEAFLAPICNKCNIRIKGDCLNALDRQWHPECFICAYCKKPFGNNSFYLEDALPYCEKDWNELFTTKCIACGFPIEAGDRWVEALNNNYHSQCFKCSLCGKNLEGQSFYAKGGKPFCKQHAR